MTLIEKYIRQCKWRNWESYIDKLPVGNHDTLLDLGCSIGTVTKLLSKKAYQIVGIDFNFEQHNILSMA